MSTTLEAPPTDLSEAINTLHLVAVETLTRLLRTEQNPQELRRLLAIAFRGIKGSTSRSPSDASPDKSRRAFGSPDASGHESRKSRSPRSGINSDGSRKHSKSVAISEPNDEQLSEANSQEHPTDADPTRSPAPVPVSNPSPLPFTPAPALNTAASELARTTARASRQGTGRLRSDPFDSDQATTLDTDDELTNIDDTRPLEEVEEIHRALTSEAREALDQFLARRESSAPQPRSGGFG